MGLRDVGVFSNGGKDISFVSAWQIVKGMHHQGNRPINPRRLRKDLGLMPVPSSYEPPFMVDFRYPHHVAQGGWTCDAGPAASTSSCSVGWTASASNSTCSKGCVNQGFTGGGCNIGYGAYLSCPNGDGHVGDSFCGVPICCTGSTGKASGQCFTGGYPSNCNGGGMPSNCATGDCAHSCVDQICNPPVS